MFLWISQFLTKFKHKNANSAILIDYHHLPSPGILCKSPFLGFRVEFGLF